MANSTSKNHCWKCGGNISLPSSGRPGRTETCPGCKNDLHACKNCKHYDPAAYNSCREPQADRIVDKERANFCDLFTFRSGPPGSLDAGKEAAKRKLDDLFK